jgi:hypothetical protein
MNQPETVFITTAEEPFELYGEHWVHFHEAAQEAAKHLEISIGSAERRLREQCASGDIRSIRYTITYDEDDRIAFLKHPCRVKPSEWQDQLDVVADLESDELKEILAWIDVSHDDVVYWITEELVAAGKLRDAPKPAAARGGKVPRIIAHLAKRFPNGVPEPALCPRKDLQGSLVKGDKSLAPLDLATLKTAIDQYNGSIRNDPKRS